MMGSWVVALLGWNGLHLRGMRWKNRDVLEVDPTTDLIPTGDDSYI